MAMGEDVNQSSIQAAALLKIPAVGTGGSSVGKAMEKGVVFGESFGGSVATTARSKAISYAVGFARIWGLRIQLPGGSLIGGMMTWFKWAGGRNMTHSSPPSPSSSPSSSFKLHSLLDGCLPAFLATSALVSLARKLSWIEEQFNGVSRELSFESLGVGGGGSSRAILMILLVARENVVRMADAALAGLPAVVLGMSAKQSVPRGHSFGEVELMASLIAGSFLTTSPPQIGKSICGVIGGLMVSWICSQLLYCTAMRGYPATAGTILSSGGGGVFVGVFTSTIQLVICPVAEAYVGSLDLLLLSEIYWIRTGLGAVLGVTMVWASMRGYYHTILLPLILLEMEVRKCRISDGVVVASHDDTAQLTHTHTRARTHTLQSIPPTTVAAAACCCYQAGSSRYCF